MRPDLLRHFEILKADITGFKVRHKTTGRIFTIEHKCGEYILWSHNPSIGPDTNSAFVMRVDSLRRVLTAIGYMR
jgi:hypothetical protein